MDSSTASFVSGEQKKGIYVKKTIAALIVVAMFGLGALTSSAISGGSVSNPVTLFGLTGEPKKGKSAIDLLVQYGKNATVLQPTMLAWSDCIICYTCGESWPYKVIELSTGPTYEYSGSCAGGSMHYRRDNAYVCCEYNHYR